MDTRTLGRTGRSVSVVGLGTWQLGADWGEVSESDALAVLEASAEAGVTFYDTADVYGDGRSEQIVGRFLADHPDAGFTRGDQDGATGGAGAGELRRGQLPGLDRPVPAQPRRRPARPGPAALPADRRGRRRRDVRRPRHAGRGGRDRGVRPQRRDRRPGARRDRAPARRDRADHPERVPAQAARRGAACRASRPASGIIARVPLASGLLSGQVRPATPPSPTDDHRSYNRDGSAFDVGETFSGVDYDDGSGGRAGVRRARRARAASTSRRRRRPSRGSCQQPGVSTVIPGARNVDQAEANAAGGLGGAASRRADGGHRPPLRRPRPGPGARPAGDSADAN